MPSGCRPARMSSQNYHHVVAALGTLVPQRRLFRALEEQTLSPLSANAQVDQHRCVDMTSSLARRRGDPLLLARGFQRLHRENRFFTSTLQKTPGDALATLLQFQRYISLNTELADLKLHIQTSGSRLFLHRRAEFADCQCHALSLMYSSARLLGRAGLGRLTGLTLCERPGSQDRTALQALFDAPIEYGAQQDSLLFDNGPLLRDIGARAPLAVLGGYERRLRSARPDLLWSDSVRGLLPMVLGLPGTPLTVCASLLAVGERTLQRRVEHEGVSFRDLLRESRRQLAEQLLSLPQISTDQLAVRLGYHQSAQFYRAFRGWFGESPGRLRATG